jgi:hypothetical protein
MKKDLMVTQGQYISLFEKYNEMVGKFSVYYVYKQTVEISMFSNTAQELIHRLTENLHILRKRLSYGRFVFGRYPV